MFFSDSFLMGSIMLKGKICHVGSAIHLQQVNIKAFIPTMLNVLKITTNLYLSVLIATAENNRSLNRKSVRVKIHQCHMSFNLSLINNDFTM